MKKFLLLILFCFLFTCVGCEVPSKEVKVYLLKGGRLATVSRTIPTIETPIMIAISELMNGPNVSEQMEGYSTEIPEGTRARDIDIEGKTAIIDFNSKLASHSGDNKEIKKMLAQIVYTATSIKGIKEVLFKIQGEDNFELGSERYVVDHPLERGDVKF